MNESRHVYMSHIIDEACHKYEWIMSHIRMSHVVQASESRHMQDIWMRHVMYKWVMSHIDESCHIWMSLVTHWCVMSHIRISHVTKTNESRHTHELVMSRTRHVNEWYHACHTWMSHITHMNESCHTYERVTSHTRTSLMQDTYMSHVTRGRVKSLIDFISHIQMSHATRMNESHHSNERVRSLVGWMNYYL